MNYSSSQQSSNNQTSQNIYLAFYHLLHLFFFVLFITFKEKLNRIL